MRITGTTAILSILLFIQLAFGQFNGAVSLDGDGDYIDISEIAEDIGYVNHYTLELFLKADINLQTHSDPAIFSVYDPQYQVALSVLSLNVSGNVVVKDGTGVIHTSSASIGDNSFHQICLTCSNTEGSKLYIDGEISGQFGFIGILYSRQMFHIGQEYIYSAGQPVVDKELVGTIDDVRIWDIATDDMMVRWNAQHQLTGKEPGLIGYWMFDEQIDNEIWDATDFKEASIINGVFNDDDAFLLVPGNQPFSVNPSYNYAPNWDFSTDYPWSQLDDDGSISLSDVSPFIGEKCLLVEPNNTNTETRAGFIFYQGTRTFDQLQGEDLTLTMWIKCTGSDPSSATDVKVGINSSISGITACNATAWQKVTYIVPGATSSNPYFDVSVYGTGDDFYVDCVELSINDSRKYQETTQFVNGNFIPEWSFEEGAGSWQALNGALVETDQSGYFGEQCLKVTTAGNSLTDGCEYTLDGTALLDKAVKLSCFIWCETYGRFAMDINGQTVLETDETVYSGWNYIVSNAVTVDEGLLGSSDDLVCTIRERDTQNGTHYFKIDGVLLEVVDNGQETEPVVSRQFINTNEKVEETVTRFDQDSSLVMLNIYNNRNLPVKSSLAFRVRNILQRNISDAWGTCNTQYIDDANEYLDASGFPFSETEYELGYENRVVKQVFPGDILQSHPVITTYGVNSTSEYGGSSEYEEVSQTNSDGVVTKSLKNRLGNVVMSIEDYDGLYKKCGFKYSLTGEVTEIYPPNYYLPQYAAVKEKLVTRYIYDTNGRVIAEEHPDMIDDDGTTYPEYDITYNPDKRYRYDERGNVKIMQDANQKIRSNTGGYGLCYTAIGYDSQNRMIECYTIDNSTSGLTWESIDLSLEPSAGCLGATLRVANAYDSEPIWTAEPWVNFKYTIPSITTRPGYLSVSAYWDDATQDYGFTFYSYNKEGNVDKIIQCLPGGVIEPQILEYKYTYGGQLSHVAHPGSGVEYNYTYDHKGRLSIVEVPNSSKCIYTYRGDGKLHAVEYYDASSILVQTMRYGYDYNGKLVTINDVENIGTAAFAEKISYYHQPGLNSDGSQSQSYYTGNLSETEYWVKGTTFGSDIQYKYTYGYDGLERLKIADYAEYTGSGWVSAGTGKYDLHDVVYDNNNNLLGFEREHLSETYQFTGILEIGTNRLFHAEGNTTDPNYAYDANGNMVMDLEKGIGSTPGEYTKYNYSNLPVLMNLKNGTASAKMYFSYDENGNRVAKKITNE